MVQSAMSIHMHIAKARQQAGRRITAAIARDREQPTSFIRENKVY